jgi:dehydrogenase/reductase SDR family protein 1
VADITNNWNNKMSKICIITGASRGLGRGIAKVLAEERSATVYATARSETALNDLASSLKSNTGVIHPIVLDQSDDDAVKKFITTEAEKEGRIDLLVNSAYGGLTAMAPHFGKPFWERPISVFDASIDIGLRSAFVSSAIVAPHMVSQKSGLIVQVSSFGGHSYLFDVGYGVGKAGLDRLSADMATELNEHGVKSLTLYPGGAVTEIARFPGGETPTFTGRSVAALLYDTPEDDLANLNGKVVLTMELALKHGFTDLSGALPDGPYSGEESAKNVRTTLSKTPVQYSVDDELPNPNETNSSDAAGLFPGA